MKFMRWTTFPAKLWTMLRPMKSIYTFPKQEVHRTSIYEIGVILWNYNNHLENTELTTTPSHCFFFFWGEIVLDRSEKTHLRNTKPYPLLLLELKMVYERQECPRPPEVSPKGQPQPLPSLFIYIQRKKKHCHSLLKKKHKDKLTMNSVL